MTDTEIEHCDWRDFLTSTDETPAHVIEALDAYFKPFAKIGSNCPGCGATVFASTFMDAMLTATFEWGMVHGHGHCRTCRWPAVAYHSIKDADGKELAALLNVGLILHPGFVEKRKTGSDKL